MLVHITTYVGILQTAVPGVPKDGSFLTIPWRGNYPIQKCMHQYVLLYLQYVQILCITGFTVGIYVYQLFLNTAIIHHTANTSSKLDLKGKLLEY